MLQIANFSPNLKVFVPRKPFHLPHSIEVDESLPTCRVGIAPFVDEPFNMGVVGTHMVVPFTAFV